MRRNLAYDLADVLRDRIADGRLPSGRRVNEVALAAELEVSRTPVREALSHLAAEGFVEVKPRRGFFVQELRSGLAEQLYGVRAVLDPAALELAGLPSSDRLDRLAELNEGIRAVAADEVETIIDRDNEWHMVLLDHCPNRILVDLIRQFMRRTRPLERAFLRSHLGRETMASEHDRIVAALGAGDLAAGVAALGANMRSGMGPILEWLAVTRPTEEEMRCA